MLSADGKILVVATISTIKLFSVRRRKGDEKGTLRIQKLDVPKALAEDGARVVTVAPNGQWVCVVRPNSAMYLARIKPASTAQEKPHILSQLVKLNRATRHTRFEKASHGTLGDYERTVRCVVFSDDSKVLASGDLSGCVDTWSLQKVEDAPQKRNGAAGSDDESSDDEDQPVIEGERWHHAAEESPIPRLKSGVVLLSFRPPNPAKTKLLTNGVASDEHRLMALTSEHQLVEFDAVEGKLSDWSRRNPKAFLPAEFRGVKDRAMGCVWDLSAARERLWLYGTSWLWMFDLNQDFPSPEELDASADNHEDLNASTQLSKKANQKRKRDPFEEEENGRKKPNSGAGDRMSLAQSDIFFGSKMRKIVGHDESQAEWVSLDKERTRGGGDGDDEAYDYDEAYTANNDVALARLRRERQFIETSTPLKRISIGGKQDKLLSMTPGDFDTPSQKQLVQTGDQKSSQPPRRWWHTYKYRDLLGIVPLGSDPDADTDNHFLEVAVVERPMWDVDLPGRYVRDYA